uniref:Uncharacterized protein n=1 Tax=Leersia perrieri TaxID=77586 RepID=A0A0D9Y0Z8_9ORYZ
MAYNYVFDYIPWQVLKGLQAIKCCQQTAPRRNFLTAMPKPSEASFYKARPGNPFDASRLGHRTLHEKMEKGIRSVGRACCTTIIVVFTSIVVYREYQSYKISKRKNALCGRML